MSRVRYATNLDEELLLKAKHTAELEGLEGANAIIEKALRVYFANCTAEIWEKALQGGWVKKLVVRPDKVTFESIRSRKMYARFNPKYYTQEVLEAKGFRRVWKLKTATGA